MLRVVNFGSVISFLSHAVVTGFITAAAILIISSQFPLMIGLASSPETSIVGVYSYLVEEAGQFNQAVLSVSLIAVAVLIFCRSYLGLLLKRAGLADAVIDSLVKSGPMYGIFRQCCPR